MLWLQPVFCLLIAFCCCSSSFAQPPEAIEHGPRDSRKIALTFDACPTGTPDEYDEKVIDVLLRENVPATLFLSGRWVEKNEERAKFLSLQPRFEIANHSYFHPHMMEKEDDRVKRELAGAQTIIRKVTGKKTRYFRAPYGEVDERIVKIAAEAGLTTIQYDVASGDPDEKLSGKKIVRSVLSEAKGGSIVVFHMNRNGVHTAEILPEIIAGLRQKGFTLVTVGDLLQRTEGKKVRKEEGRSVEEGPLALLPSHVPAFPVFSPQAGPFLNR